MRCELQNMLVAVERAEIFTESRDIFQNLTDSWHSSIPKDPGPHEFLTS